LIPHLLFSQTEDDTLTSKQKKDIYTIVQLVIKKEKLNKHYGLELSPASNCNINHDDTTYLQTLLIKPKHADTTSKADSTELFVVSNFTSPDKNILTWPDIDHILRTKQLFKDFKWDNKQLGFNLRDTKNYYTFSVPYFNLNR